MHELSTKHWCQRRQLVATSTPRCFLPWVIHCSDPSSIHNNEEGRILLDCREMEKGSSYRVSIDRYQCVQKRKREWTDDRVVRVIHLP